MNEKLVAFKKNNKIRREVIALKEGFSNSEAYIKFLEKNEDTIIGKEMPKSKRVKKDTDVGKTTDYVIAFDTTGSMGSYIAAVRRHVVDLVPELFRTIPNLRVKIVAFGDYCDMINEKTFGNAYQETQLTDNQQVLINFVKDAKGTGGGDSEEFYELVMKKILDETPWRGGIQNVLLIADDKPHEKGYSLTGKVKQAQIDWKEQAFISKGMNVKWDTLSIHPSVQWYKELSEITGGANMPFQSSHKMSQVVAATAYARSAPETFSSMYTATMDSGDAELIGTYKSLSKL